MGMLLLIWRELGMGKFPHSWLSSHSEKGFPHSRLRRSWGNNFSLFLLSHSWGNGDVPFVTHGEIFFSAFVASPLRRKNPIPNSLQMRNRPFPSVLTKRHHISGSALFKDFNWWVQDLVISRKKFCKRYQAWKLTSAAAPISHLL